MIDPASCELLFGGRTYRRWQDKSVPDSLLRELYSLMRSPPTEANSNPARVLFVRQGAAKQRLADCMSEGNREPTLRAPVTAIIGMALDFTEHLPLLVPHTDAKAWFANEQVIRDTAFRNSSLQGAYLILAGRALGLDCGPMTGFDAKRIDSFFFEGSATRVNFVCNLGYGEPNSTRPRAPRLAFEEACAIL